MSQCEQQYNEDRSRALAALYQAYDGFIQSIIRYSAKNQADQEDIYQEVFLVLSQKADLNEIQDFKSYLYRLVVNKSNEFLRRKITQELRLKKYMELHSQEVVQEDQDEELLIVDEVDGMLELMQDRLSQRESEAIQLRYKYHYSNEEAAQKMNVKKETLIRYVSVGLKKIRDILKSIGKS